MMGLCAAQSLFGQAPQSQPVPQVPTKGTQVALVDIGHVLKNHPTMNDQMKAVDAEIAKAQEEIESRRKSLLAETEMVSKNFDSSSPSFKEKQEALIVQEGKLRVDFMGKEKEFAERRAAIIYQSYQAVNAAISLVAKYKNYDLVLRYDRKQNEMDPKNPNSVNYVVSRDILFMNPESDLTDMVLQVVIRDASPSAQSPMIDTRISAPGGPAGPGTRTGNNNKPTNSR
jgi:Skp family chaperone for outer membrane proteins